MPNHCHNRVTIYGSGDEQLAQIAKIKGIFEDESIFTHFIPEPNWATTPNKDGEVPVAREYPYPPQFPKSGKTDDRWYDWRIQNWGTKWDAYSMCIDDCDMPNGFEVEFETAWAPPEEVCNAIREQFDDLSMSWFYDEPGCEIAGYL